MWTIVGRVGSGGSVGCSGRALGVAVSGERILSFLKKTHFEGYLFCFVI